MTGPEAEATVADAAPVSPRSGPSWRSHALFWGKMILSVGLLAAVIWKVRPTLPSLDRINWGTIAIATALLAAHPPLIAWRWRLILRAFGRRSSYFPLVQSTWVSVLAGQFLPASVGGDVVRVLLMRGDGAGLGLLASSVVVDRAVALVGIAVLAIMFCPLLLTSADASMMWLTAGIAGLGLLGVPVLALLTGPIETAASRFRWIRPVAVLFGYIRIFLARPALALGALGIALLIHALSAAALVVISAGLGISMEPLHLVGISVIITFAMALPISIAGWGVREAVAVTLLGAFQVPGDTALLAALLLGMAYALASLPGGIIWLVRARKTDT
ncbi:MAG TPA: lysylphosphatidylglycerol synthase transmembrane domain-containing protein [Hyphomonadaceae bacterium]|nr:lysylphosphatidylglycerol synthase transmembrane domain-containing protein [Hyphomonadaceae bacterium]